MQIDSDLGNEKSHLSYCGLGTSAALPLSTLVFSVRYHGWQAVFSNVEPVKDCMACSWPLT